MTPITFYIPCLFGLEALVGDELRRLHLKDIRVENGHVLCCGTVADVARLNLNLRCGERVLVVLGAFTASSFDALFEQTKALPWENWIPRDGAFPVKGYSLDSTLHSVPDCQKIIKKAVATRLGAKYGTGQLPETGAKYQIQFGMMNDRTALFLDTSGAGLHKRGYRQTSLLAPIKETLAAGIVDFTRLYDDSVICDPFCGSGTLLIEAVLKGMNIAPGINRRFAAEKWNCIPAAVWKDARMEALESVKRDAKIKAYGYDIDPQAVELTMANAKKAGVSAHIRTKVQNISQLSLPPGRAIVICNPPYGERLLEIKEAEQLYRTMGKVFPADPDKKYYVISPHEEFEHIFGRTADRRRKLYNGMIKCQLFMYFR